VTIPLRIKSAAITRFAACEGIIALLLRSYSCVLNIRRFSQTARFESPQSTVPPITNNSPLKPITGSMLAVFGNSLAGGVAWKASAVSVSCPFGSSAFKGAFSTSFPAASARLVTGFVISGASSVSLREQVRVMPRQVVPPCSWDTQTRGLKCRRGSNPPRAKQRSDQPELLTLARFVRCPFPCYGIPSGVRR